jgi:ferric enterobactin receptor
VKAGHFFLIFPLHSRYFGIRRFYTFTRHFLSKLSLTYPYSSNSLKKLAALFLFVLQITFLYAQHSAIPAAGKIEGTIVDSASRNFVEYATVAVYPYTGDKIVTGATTDEKGKFTIDKVPQGSYRIVIDFIGYRRKTIGPVSCDGKSVVSLGNIVLSVTSTTLKEANVTAQRNVIENKIDKMIYNAENDLTSQSGVATDVLKKVPQVTVDINGNVELQGNSNIRFLIDGKPSTVFGNNITDVLQTLPASRIQRIEVVTTPGAKYDAEGTGGIINIILKKTTIRGISGNVSASAGTRLENGSLNLNARSGKFGVNAYLSGNTQVPSTTLNTMDRWSTDSLSKTNLTQDGSSDFKRYGYQAGLGFDWGITKKDNLNGSFNYNYNGNKYNNVTDQRIVSYDSFDTITGNQPSVLKSLNEYSGQTYDWSLNYKHIFGKKDHYLNFLYNSSYSNSTTSYLQTQNLPQPDSILTGSKGNNPGTNQETNLSLDYVLPVGEKFELEAGAKAVFYALNSKTDAFSFLASVYDFVPDNKQSYSLKYDRNIYAGYLSAGFQLFKWLDGRAGIRYEYTQTKITYTNNPNYSIPDYGTIAPSLTLSHSFKNNHTLRLSYSYRINRPDYRDLNPFINLSDPHNISTGNPALKPETVHGIELNYSKSFKKGGNFNVSAFYRLFLDDIQSFVTYYPSYQIGDSVYTDVTVTSRENIAREQRGGLNLYGSFTLVKGLGLRGNLSFYDRYIENNIGSTGNINSFEYRINLNISYQLPWDLAVEFFGNFNSPRTTVQGKVPSFTTYNFALRKQLFKKTASIAITAVNPFNKYIEQKTSLEGDNFTLNSLRQLPFRSFGINLTWKFGKLQFKPERDEERNEMMNPQGL